MATRRGAPQGNTNRGSGRQQQNREPRTRVSIGAGWINPDEKRDEIFDALQDGRIRISLGEDVMVVAPVDDGNGNVTIMEFKADEIDINLFRNDNDKGKGPHVNMVGYAKV